MSEEQLKAFIAKVRGNSSIQDKLKAAQSPEDVVAIAKEYGHELTADKIANLSEEDLEGLAGGANCVVLKTIDPTVMIATCLPVIC